MESLEFAFTSLASCPAIREILRPKERREFHIPKGELEKFFSGTQFEIQFKNNLTQRAITRECAD